MSLSLRALASGLKQSDFPGFVGLITFMSYPLPASQPAVAWYISPDGSVHTRLPVTFRAEGMQTVVVFPLPVPATTTTF